MEPAQKTILFLKILRLKYTWKHGKAQNLISPVYLDRL